jgi:chlorobactene glucosyltransferase
MLYQQIVFLLLTAVLVNLLLNLRSLRKAQAYGELPDPSPLISVLIPARNEETTIRTCLDSLLQQDYSNFEVLVLDDSSTDRTAQIVAEIAAQDPRVRLLHGQPLPPGWAGKPFACQQLADEARGSWLLFTDSDTVHAPFALRTVLQTAIRSRAALVSGFPHQRSLSVWHKMAMPILFYFVLLCWVPFWWLQHSRRNLPSVTIGQFLFFSAEEYRNIGGHEAVKSRLMEDVWLGRELARHGYKQLTLDLSPLVSCTMYRGLGTMWEGITRWIYSVASLSALALIGMVAVAVLLFLAPFLWLAHGLLLSEPPFGWQALVALQVAILLLARYLAGRRFSQPTSSTIMHPIGVSFLVVVCLYAGYRRLRGTGVSWKERVYDPKSQVS